jgi:hypothetical protein
MSRVPLLIGGLLFAMPAWAEPLRLGAIHLSDHPERDVLVLPGCEDSENDPVTRLMVRVNEYEAEISTLEVKFHNGDVQTLEVRNRFAPGTESRWIDMSGDARCIAQIRVGGDTNTIGRRPGKQAQVVFWGAAGEQAAAASADEGPFLGRIVLSDHPERDVLDLPACGTDGNHLVREMRLAVAEHVAEIDRVKLVFENGGETIVDVRHRFEPGESSVWKELPGEARCIDKIIVLGDANTIGRTPGKQAVVKFFGR